MCPCPACAHCGSAIDLTPIIQSIAPRGDLCMACLEEEARRQVSSAAASGVHAKLVGEGDSRRLVVRNGDRTIIHHVDLSDPLQARKAIEDLGARIEGETEA